MDYIATTLNIGRVYTDLKIPSAIFRVTAQQELIIILKIFASFNLNTTKHLDFLAFEQAFKLYTDDSSHKARGISKPLILNILNKMNKQRTNFEISCNHFKITSYWLLGFVEGDGSFYLNFVDNTLIFKITQKGNLTLLNAIKDFFVNLTLNKQDS